MSSHFGWDLTASTAPSALPAALRIVAIGDSTVDDAGGGVGDYDSATVPANVTLWYKGTEHSATATTTYPATPGIAPYLIASALSAGCTSVQYVSQAITGSRWVTIGLDQITAARAQWNANGWADPHFVLIGGMTNDVSANGIAAAGAWTDGSAITAASVASRVRLAAERIRAHWPNARILFWPPTTSDANYTQSSDLRAWIAAAIATVGNAAVVDNYGNAYEDRLAHKDSKHGDQDDPTKGYAQVGDRIVAAVVP